MNNKSIGFFDSGVGGLTVLKKVKELLPNENFLYFGDLKNAPYGEKSKEELINISDKVFEFFVQKKVKVVIMACNTTSAIVYDALKDKYKFKIYPIIQSCANMLTQLPVRNFGVFATEATIKSGVYTRELKKYNSELKIFETSCPPWVKIIEESKQDEPKSLKCIEDYMKKMLKYHPDKIILGCTHYPYLLKKLQKFTPKDIFINPADYFAKFIKEDLLRNDMLNVSVTEGSEEFFVSANPENFKRASSMFYPLKKSPILISL